MSVSIDGRNSIVMSSYSRNQITTINMRMMVNNFNDSLKLQFIVQVREFNQVKFTSWNFQWSQQEQWKTLKPKWDPKQKEKLNQPTWQFLWHWGGTCSRPAVVGIWVTELVLTCVILSKVLFFPRDTIWISIAVGEMHVWWKED